ncbi:MAG: hypothetical protein KC413_15025 [Anaerolineales bacterium]|nr:hypothetical protein [Anaerolineales bacterium]
MMIVLNFGHPLTEDRLSAIRVATGQTELVLRQVKTHIDPERPFPDQIAQLINDLNINSQTWQTEPMLINPPTHNIIAAALLAELHGRMGYFPAIKPIHPRQRPAAI